MKPELMMCHKGQIKLGDKDQKKYFSVFVIS